MEATRILWSRDENGSAVIHRFYGTEKHVVIPSYVEGVQVSQIGSYCFSDAGKIPVSLNETYLNAEEGMLDHLRELTGDYIESADIPDTVTGMGNFAFYNCRNLRKIKAGPSLTEIGSDVFMNCTNLYDIIIRSGPGESTGLMQLLGRISSEVRAAFLNKGRIEGVFVYPEYFETYDEIAPAHIFGRNIDGEGFRARQCFDNGVLNTAQYDGIFDKASVEEAPPVIFMMAAARLLYPFGLSDGSRQKYEDYIKRNDMGAVQWLVSLKWTEALGQMAGSGLLSLHALNAGVAWAVDMGWSEGAAYLMKLCHETGIHIKASRYEF